MTQHSYIRLDFLLQSSSLQELDPVCQASGNRSSQAVRETPISQNAPQQPQIQCRCSKTKIQTHEIAAAQALQNYAFPIEN